MSDEISVGVADIVTAFDEKAIGTKVLDKRSFYRAVVNAIKVFDWDTCRQKGQAYIVLPIEACRFVTSGIGKNSMNPDDYVIRVYRERVGLFLKRKCAEPASNVAVVVDTHDAYLADPQVTPEEIERISGNYTHVVIAVLASSNIPSTVSPHRFVQNLAGGNNEEMNLTGDEIRAKAVEIKRFSGQYRVVAD